MSRQLEKETGAIQHCLPAMQVNWEIMIYLHCIFCGNIPNIFVLEFPLGAECFLFGATAAVLQVLHNSGRQVTAVQLLRSQSLVRRKGKPVVLHKVSSTLCICSWLPSVVLLTVTFPADQVFE